MGRPILITGMARSGGSWVSRMVAGGGDVVHINEPFNRRHPPGLTPGILRVPPPRAYQYVGQHNEDEYVAGFRDMLRLRYNLVAELRANRGIYDLAKMAKYATAFSHGRARGMRPLIDDPYMVFAAEWMAERLDCQVVMLVRHPAGIVSSLARIGTGWSDNLPDIASQPELVRDYLAPYADELRARRRRAPRSDRARRAPVAGHPRWDRPPGCAESAVRRRPLRGSGERSAERVPGALRPPRRGDVQPQRRGGRPQRLPGRPRRNAPCRGAGSGLARTAFQPMQSQANAWAWRDRLSDAHIAEIIESTRDVAERFYTPSEIEGRPAVVPGVSEAASALRPALAGRRRWRSA